MIGFCMKRNTCLKWDKQLLILFAKSSIVDVWKGSEYVCGKVVGRKSFPVEILIRVWELMF